jgi:hypothetical protein
VLAAALAAGAASMLAVLAGPVGAQDAPTTSAVESFGGSPETSTTVAPTPAGTDAETDAGTDAEVGDGTQTLTEGRSEERSLTESRKVLAVIAGLVIAAIGLALLTLRYWRATTPIDPGAGTDPPMLGTEAALAIPPTVAGTEAPGRPAALAAAEASAAPRSTRSVAGADHARADADWEPRGTGEHAAIVVPVARSSRPGRAARAAALGRSSST